MAHAWKYNKGVPVNAAGGALVAPCEWWPPIAPDGSDDKSDDKPNRIIEITGTKRSDTLITTATILAPNPTAAVATKDSIDESINVKFEDFTSSLDGQEPDPIKPAPQQQVDSNNALVDAFAKALNQSNELRCTNRTSESTAATPSNLIKIRLFGSKEKTTFDNPSLLESRSPTRPADAIPYEKTSSKKETKWIDTENTMPQTPNTALV